MINSCSFAYNSKAMLSNCYTPLVQCYIFRSLNKNHYLQGTTLHSPDRQVFVQYKYRPRNMPTVNQQNLCTRFGIEIIQSKKDSAISVNMRQ